MFGRGKKEENVNPKKAPKAIVKKESEVLSEIIKKADEALLITATKGNIEVRALKNLTYAHEAKGLIAGALDTYLIRPISNTLNQSYQTTARNFGPVLSNLNKVLQKVQKIAEKLGVIDEEKPGKNK